MKILEKIKNSLYRILVWCAGSNPDILSNNARFANVITCGRSEQIKHAWIGALVLIPSILAFCGMLYAASTLDISNTTIVFIAILYSIIVFIIERYIVSSFRKSSSIIKDFFSLTFFIRFIFSIGLGLTISDPLIHGVFKESIEKKLTEMNLAEIDSINATFNLRIKIQEQKKDSLYGGISAKTNLITSYDTLLTDEIEGIVGQSSGVAGDGKVAAEKRKTRDRLIFERDNEEADYKIEKRKIDSIINKLEESRQKRLDEVKFSDDYLARRHAFDLLARDPKNKDIATVRLVLMVFLILLDICCILYKVVSPKGPYDDHLNLEEFISDIDAKQEKNDAQTYFIAKKEFSEVEGKNIYIQSIELKHKLKANRESVKAIYESERLYNQKLTDEHIRFGKFISKRKQEISRIGDEEIRAREETLLSMIIKSFYQKSEEALNEHLRV